MYLYDMVQYNNGYMIELTYEFKMLRNFYP